MESRRKKRNNNVKLDARTCDIFERLYAGEIRPSDANGMLDVFNVRSLKAYKMWLGVANWMLNNPYISTEAGEYILRAMKGE